MQVDVFNQVRKIGSFCCLVAVSFPSFASDIHMSVQSIQGIPLTSVAVGKPFLLIVSIKNPDAIESSPLIEGIASFHSAGQSNRTLQTQKGAVLEEELSVIYTLVAEKPGRFRLGPARFRELPGKQSESITIEVVEQVKDEKNLDFDEPKLTLQLEKSEAYIGEKIPFVLRFSWQEPELKPIHLEIPKLPDVQIKEVSKGTAKTERKGNKVYNVLEFSAVLYPERAGIITIPQLRADYTVPREERRWSTFFPFPMQDRESTFSSSARLIVHELPPYDKPVVGIGNLKRFAALVSPAEIQRGEAGTLILSVQGDADFSQLKVPTPNLPSSFRAYPSKTTLERNGTGVQWSYVLQGLEEGTFTIPPQILTYFDTHSKSYKTLQTQPLSLTVTPGLAKNSEAQILHEEKEPAQEELAVPTEQNTSFPSLPQIPLGLFIALMFIPIALRLGRVVIDLAAQYITTNRARRLSRNALKKGSKKVHLLEKTGNVKDVYRVVKSSIAEFLGLKDPQDEEIIVLLEELGYSQQVIKDVRSVLEDSLRVSDYAQKRISNEQELFQRAFAALQSIATRSNALFLICLLSSSLQGAQGDSLLQKAALSLEVVPFVSLQLGVLICWWLLWWGATRFPSELRYFLMVVWLGFLIAWAVRLPHELSPLARVIDEVPLLVGPSEKYPSRAMLAIDDELALVKREGAWYYVSSLKGKGWVPAACIRR